jgi:hypothetical protein
MLASPRVAQAGRKRVATERQYRVEAQLEEQWIDNPQDGGSRPLYRTDTTLTKPHTPMDRKALISAVKEAFEGNPTTEKFYVTRDGQCFFKENDAVNHQRFLGPHNAGIEEFTRETLKGEGKGSKASKSEKEEGAGAGEQGASGGGTEAASSDQSTGTNSSDETDEERAAREADAKASEEGAAADAAAAAEAAASNKTAAKKAAPKKAAAKKSTTKKK